MALALLANIGVESCAESLDGLIRVDMSYLVAGQPVPCRIFVLHSSCPTCIYSAGEMVQLHDLPRLRVEFYGIGFVKTDELESWTSWVRGRHTQSTELAVLTDKVASLMDRRAKPHETFRNLYVSHAFDAICFNTAGPEEAERLERCNQFFRRTAENEAIDWYFHKKPREELYRHSARVSYMTLLFTTFTLPRMPLEALEALILSAIIHELAGDPADTSGKTVSVTTIDILRDSKRPIPEKVLAAIREQDERFNGHGAPRGLAGEEISVLSRIFAFANVYDHLYLRTQGGSRRVRSEQALRELVKRKDDFDPKLIRRFLQFILRVEIIE